MSGFRFPTPSLTPMTPTDTSNTAPNKQAQSIAPTMSASHSMSIESMLDNDSLETPPISTNTSFSDAGHAPRSHHQVSTPVFTTSPIKYATALPAIIASFSPHPMSEAVRGNCLPETLPITPNTSISEHDHAAKARHHDSSHIITSPVNNNPASSVDVAQAATNRNNGKRRDPEHHDVNHTEAGNTTEEIRRPEAPRFENRHAKWSRPLRTVQDYDAAERLAAESLIRLKNPEEFLAADLIHAIIPYESKTETQKLVAAVSTLVNLPYASDTESQDEGGPPLSTARKISFHAYTGDDEPVPCLAVKGNAVFDLMARRDSNATVSVADDDDDAAAATIELDDANYPTKISSKPPRLSRKQIEGLEQAKREWTPGSYHHLPATTGTTSARPFSSPSVTEAGESIRPESWSYATESYIRSTRVPEDQHGGGSYTDPLTGYVFYRREAPTAGVAFSPAPPTITTTTTPPPPTRTTTTNPHKRRKRNPHPPPPSPPTTTQARYRSSNHTQGSNTQGWIKREDMHMLAPIPTPLPASAPMPVPAPAPVKNVKKKAKTREKAEPTIIWKPNKKREFVRYVDEVVSETGVGVKTRAQKSKEGGEGK